MTARGARGADGNGGNHHRRRLSRWRTALLSTVIGVMALITVAALLVSGVVWPTRVAALRYAVQGVDVSSYQGDIDWSVLAAQGVDFAYIKATEGAGQQDDRFAANWADAHRTDLLVGAYHFLSVDSSAADQAANIIATVERRRGDLPLVVDVECYARYCEHPPTRQRVRATLDPLLSRLEHHYGRPAVLYATRDWYERYLAGACPDDPIWFRSVLTAPHLADDREWTFWQWSARERLDGYDGDEAFIDRNAFHGDRADLEAMRLP